MLAFLQLVLSEVSFNFISLVFILIFSLCTLFLSSDAPIQIATPSVSFAFCFQSTPYCQREWWVESQLEPFLIWDFGAFFFFFLICTGQYKLKVVRQILYISEPRWHSWSCLLNVLLIFFFLLLLIPSILLCCISLSSLKRRLACRFLESFNLYKIITDVLSCNF